MGIRKCQLHRCGQWLFGHVHDKHNHVNPGVFIFQKLWLVDFKTRSSSQDIGKSGTKPMEEPSAEE
jgi:hypothetical protein